MKKQRVGRSIFSGTSQALSAPAAPVQLSEDARRATLESLRVGSLGFGVSWKKGGERLEST